MNNMNSDLRKIGGKRVTAPFKLVVANPDPFNMHTAHFTGTIIFNVRGGCLFVDNALLSQAKTNIFNGKPTALLDTFELQTPDQQLCSMKKIKIKLSREKEIDGQPGIVFKFLQTSEAHMELLNHLTDILPNVDNDSDGVHPNLKKAG